MSFTVAVWGASGRLGALICRVLATMPEFEVVAKLGGANKLSDADGADIVVDVTNLDASREIVAHALGHGQRVLVGTSGWGSDALAELQQLQSANPGSAAIVVPNFSLGSVLQVVLARLVAPHYDSIEIVETHHPKKIDSPSGTAAFTASEIARAKADAADATNGGAEIAAPFSEQPARGELIAGVPVHSLRLAGVLAKQETRFGGVGEVLTITHETQSDAAYEAGIKLALNALTTASGVQVGLESLLEQQS